MATCSFRIHPLVFLGLTVATVLWLTPAVGRALLLSSAAPVAQQRANGFHLTPPSLNLRPCA
jgi:hypothetical protein